MRFVRPVVLVTVLLWSAACGRDSVTPVGPRAPGGVPFAFDVIANSAVVTSKAQKPTPLRYLTGAVVNGKLYTIAGYKAGDGTFPTAVERYDPTANKWDTATTLPMGGSYFSAAVLNNILYVASGLTPTSPTQYASRGFWKYDPGANAWTTLANVPRASSAAAAVSLNGFIWLLGGLDSLGNASNVVSQYNPSTNQWTTKPHMPAPLFWHGAAVINGKIYVVGGNTSGINASTRMYIFDTATQAWDSVPAPAAWSSPAVGAAGGILYVVGGLQTDMYAFNPATMHWTIVGTGPSNPARASGMVGRVMYLASGQGYVDAPTDAVAFAYAGNHPPTISTWVGWSGTVAGSEGVVRGFTAAGSDPDNDPLAYHWTFGDGGSADGASVTHIYADNGNYTLKLTVTDTAGASVSATATSQIVNIAPTVPVLASTQYPFYRWVSQSVSGNFTDPGADTWTGTINWGDGSAPAALTITNRNWVSPAHTYSLNGTDTITITITDKDGGTGFSKTAIPVWGPGDAIYWTTQFDNSHVADLTTRNALNASLSSANTAWNARQKSVAIGWLNTYKNQVATGVTGGKITSADASVMTSRANKIIQSITNAP